MQAIQNRLEMIQTNLIETSRDDIITRYAILVWHPSDAFTFTGGDGIAFQKAPMHFTVMPSMNVPNSREWLLPAIGVGLFVGNDLGGAEMG